MVADLFKLGYLGEDLTTLDPTYGRGAWWTVRRPHVLTVPPPGSDFRALPYAANTFQRITYDPPYVAAGGRKTTGLPDFFDRYGMTDAPKTPAALQTLMNEGLAEMYRLVTTKGLVMMKCKDYVSSGKLWLGTHHTLTFALSLGFECVDRWEHVHDDAPVQPPGRRQVHAWRNLSTLFVFRKPRPRPNRKESAGQIPLFESRPAWCPIHGDYPAERRVAHRQTCAVCS